MNGYINIELGGKTRGIKFGNRALLSLMTKHQINGDIKMSFELIADLIYFGLMNNCLIKKETPDFSEEDVANWVDDPAEMPIDKMGIIFEAFQKSYLSEGEDGQKKIGKSTAAKKK